jgi:hypothetical protein
MNIDPYQARTGWLLKGSTPRRRVRFGRSPGRALFWKRAAADTRLSPEFAAIAGQNVEIFLWMTLTASNTRRAPQGILAFTTPSID